jgi:ketosteroid isomerase-like protein
VTDIIELVSTWLTHMPQGDFDGFPGEVAEDFVLILPFMPPGLPTRFEGRAAAQAVLQKSARGRGPLTFIDKRILRTEDPELVVVTARAETTMANGKPYANSYVIFVRVRDGVVVEHTEYLNPLAVMAAS